MSSQRISAIPHHPLPPAATRVLHESLQKRGFDPQAMMQDFPISNRSGQWVTTNTLVFTHSVYRTPDYTGLTLFNPSTGSGHDNRALVRMLAESAAPFHLIHQHERFSFWFSTVRDRTSQQVDPIPIKSNIRYDELDAVLSHYVPDLSPERILDVKQGRAVFSNQLFHATGPFQLSLWAAEVNRGRLVAQFSRAVSLLNAFSSPRMDRQVSTMLAIQLLAATILAQTGGLSRSNKIEALGFETVIHKAHAKFPHYFDFGVFEKWGEAARQAYNCLTQISYAAFVPDMLTELVAQALTSEERKKLGSFDTPLNLTRRIWQNIPLEFLPPEKRIVADMTCGWGSFLIAGYERMSRLTDMPNHPMRDHLHGNDIMPFTASLARLALLISTSQDSWHIDNQPAQEWSWLDHHQPTIIIGNPPFGGDRKSVKGKKRRYQEADQYLKRAIERLAPHGYLAILMPQSFLSAEASPNLRQQLLETCDVTELWEIPLGTFSKATANTVVIFAQKKAQPSIDKYPVKIRTVQAKNLKLFEEEGIFTASSLANSASWGVDSRKSKGSKNTHLIDYKLILPDYTWQTIQERSVPLRDKASVFLGAIKGQNPSRKPHLDDSTGKMVPWLTGARNVIKGSFNISYQKVEQIKYPNDLEKPRLSKERMLAGTKVLISSLANPSWGKRVKAVIERKGVYVSDSFYIIVPHENTHLTPEAIAAVVDWKVSNAWIVEHLKHPKLLTRVVRSIPFPHLDEHDCQRLTQAVRCLEQTSASNSPNSACQRTRVFNTIDQILKSAYHLDDATFERLRLIAEWDKKPQLTLDTQPDPQAKWLTGGFVESVDAESGTITLWLNSFHEAQTVPITAIMPGWLLRPDVMFDTRIPRMCVRQRSLANVSWGGIYPGVYTYLSEVELLNGLHDILYSEI